MKSIVLLNKRKADFYTGIILLMIGIAMLLESLTFPMQESYAGVQNVWYVSPALLPILVSSLLIILSIVLIRKAIIDGGMRQAISDWPNLSKVLQSENFLRLLVISLYLIAYVYGLIPNSDFFICSMLFLMTFITPFYLDNNNLFIATFWPFIFISFTISLISYFEILSTKSIDFILIFTMIFVSITSLIMVKSHTTFIAKWRIAFFTSILTPSILIPAFKFGLLVPLPMEGIVIQLMESIVH